MKSRLLASGAERTFILVLDPEEEAFEAIRHFAKAENINAASVTAIGAFATATLAFFDLPTREYREIPVTEQSEVLSLLGDITFDENDTPNPHLHVVLGFADGSTRGGHFLKGVVRPTLEVVIRETPAQLRRSYRREFGIALIDPAK
ncbi:MULTISPECIES: PPC domain-containing DNA-binding protein [unclassified Rhizobium]|uniref:PPC domain-containing DNA-binding protein n=1 Tax=unclassified Rhizobium TaxID=2613769 RepID=UPI002479CA48|nr:MULTISPECIES: PPC domain-containing DNA-binding protein [unclassified Rhizobium]MDH7804071.1 putative DNA-binding protein with PD1-like motif [Rhizobium sp. AN70]